MSTLELLIDLGKVGGGFALAGYLLHLLTTRPDEFQA